MIEKYVYNKITQEPALQALLANGSTGYFLYPAVVPRGVVFQQAVTFTLITTTDVYPNAKSVNVQFNIFAQTHKKVAEIAKALADLFDEDNNQVADGVAVIFSQRNSETDLGYDFDDKIYQREATYYFKLR